jgi:hypothetical protein
MRRNARAGESFMDYALMVPILVAGFFGTAHYVKRALEGRLGGALAGDSVIGARVYVPGSTEAELTTTVVSSQIELFEQTQDEVDPEVDITNITVVSDMETTVSGRKRVDENPSASLFQ